jgi:beta-lactamase class A
MIRSAALAFAALLSAFAIRSSAGADDAPLAALEAELGAIEAESGGTLGVQVIHLESGRSAGRNTSARFPMASVYKLPIAVVVLARVEAGELKLEQEVEVLRGELRRTGAKVDPWTPGARVPIRKLVDAMLTESDNTACDVLLRVLGGGRAVDAWLAAHGFPDIDVTWSELKMAAVAAGVPDLPTDGLCDHACLDALVAGVPNGKRAAATQAFESDSRNTASPSDLGRLLTDLKAGRLLRAKSTEALLEMMRRNRTGDRRIRGLLPKGTAVWDKTGSIGRSANDVGFVALPGKKGTLAVVALVKGSTKDWGARDRAIARAAKAAYDAFAR